MRRHSFANYVRQLNSDVGNCGGVESTILDGSLGCLLEEFTKSACLICYSLTLAIVYFSMFFLASHAFKLLFPIARIHAHEEVAGASCKVTSHAQGFSAKLPITYLAQDDAFVDGLASRIAK